MTATLSFKPQLAKEVGGMRKSIEKCARPVLEPKYDGWRGIVVVGEDNKPRLYSRTGKQYTPQLPEIMDELRKFPAGTILDGEVVVMLKDNEGRTYNDCAAVTTVMGTLTTGKKAHIQREARQLAHFIAFDALRIGTMDLTGHALSARRMLLKKSYHMLQIMPTLTTVTVQYSLEGMNPTEATTAATRIYDEIVAAGGEGVMVKDLDAWYAAGKRGHGWYKVKDTTSIDCVVMELPVDGKGQHANKVGRMVVGQLVNGELKERCKVNAPDNVQRDEMTAHPERYLGRVVEVKIYGEYEDGTVRHPTFLRWREDKEPTACVWSAT